MEIKKMLILVEISQVSDEEKDFSLSILRVLKDVMGKNIHLLEVKLRVGCRKIGFFLSKTSF